MDSKFELASSKQVQLDKEESGIRRIPKKPDTKIIQETSGAWSMSAVMRLEKKWKELGEVHKEITGQQVEKPRLSPVELKAIQRQIKAAMADIESKVFSLERAHSHLIRMVEKRPGKATDEEWEKFVVEEIWPELERINKEIAVYKIALTLAVKLEKKKEGEKITEGGILKKKEEKEYQAEKYPGLLLDAFLQMYRQRHEPRL